MATGSVEEARSKLKIEHDALLVRIQQLDDEARAGLFVMLSLMVTMLEKSEGCSVTFADPLGDGVLSVLALGNQHLVTDIIHAAAHISDTMSRSPAELLQ